MSTEIFAIYLEMIFRFSAEIAVNGTFTLDFALLIAKNISSLQ